MKENTKWLLLGMRTCNSKPQRQRVRAA